MISFAMIGSGWRAAFYGRIARRYPKLFSCVGMLCRTEEKAELLRRKGFPGECREEELLAARPAFVVSAVTKGQSLPVIRHWLERGVPVLTETPAACTFEDLCALWNLHRRGFKLAVAEQYIRYPIIAAGLRAVERGVLGTPRALMLSLCHDHHAASVIRHMLQLPRHPLPDFTVRAQAQTNPVERTDSRSGPITDGTIAQSRRVYAQLNYPEGKTAFYDFDSIQYHSFLRMRHIDLRGERGQWYDTKVLYTDEAHRPCVEKLTASPIPGYPQLTLSEAVDSSWHPEIRMESGQDEYAIATMLLDMERYLAGGPEPYPMEEALEDAYTWLQLNRALETGETVQVAPRPWTASINA